MKKSGAVATARDYLEIEARNGAPARWTEADYASELLAPAVKVFHFFNSDDNLEGFVFFRAIGVDALEITHLAVATKGGGRGKIMMEAFLLEQKKAYSELRLIDLEVSASNERARRLYLKQGFVEVGRRKKYYRDGSDALLMRLLLKGSD